MTSGEREGVTIGKHFDVAPCANPDEKRVKRSRNPET